MAATDTEPANPVETDKGVSTVSHSPSVHDCVVSMHKCEVSIQIQPLQSNEAPCCCNNSQQDLVGVPPTPDDSKSTVSQEAGKSQAIGSDSHDDKQWPPEYPEPLSGYRTRTEFPKFHKLSILTTFIFVLASLTIPICIGLISFLWSNTNGHNQNKIWLRIVLSGWVLKFVTINSMFLRISASAQAGIATSMLACVIMETKGVPIHRSAAVSALRYINNGPQTLAFALRDAYAHAGPWAVVAILLYLNTLALQFGSTILVGDLAVGSLTDDPKMVTTFAALSWSAELGQLNETRLRGQTPFWTQFLPDFALFAENSENTSPGEASSQDSVRDTGTTLRAFIPVSNQSERTMIHSYSGIATVEDSRVVCIRPLLHHYFSIGSNVPGLILSEQPALISGLLPVTYNLDSNQLDNSTVTLDWSQQIPFAHDAGAWAVAQNFMYFGPALVSSLDPRYPDIAGNATSMNFTMENPDYLAWNLTYYQKDDGVRLMTGRSYELLNITASRPSNETNMFFSPQQEHHKLLVSSQDEWLVFRIPSIPDFRLSVSLCFDSFVSINAQVNITSQQPYSEPSVGHVNAASKHIETTQLRKQLGMLPDQSQCTRTRGIMTLDTNASQLRDQVQAWYLEAQSHGAENISFPTQNVLPIGSKEVYSWGTWMCGDCNLDWVNRSAANISHVANNALQEQIFQDIVLTTRDISRAFQSYYTILGRLAYYETLPYYDFEAPALITSFRHIQFPQSKRGLAWLCAVVSVHVGLIFLITTAFLMKTRFSRIGDNSWLNLVQADLKPLQGAFSACATMKDGDLEKEMVVQGMRNVIVRLN